jgi:RHS repeat-associated protein
VPDQRIKKVEGNKTTCYFFSEYEEEYTSGNLTKTTKYYFVNGQRIAERSSTDGLRYYHTDHLGSSVRITDATGILQLSIGYLPYGGTAYTSGTGSIEYQFTGKEKDTTGLYYYGSRFYDPELARFIQPDTTLGGGLNRYAYCGNNPINYTDPTGNEYNKPDFNDAGSKPTPKPGPTTGETPPPQTSVLKIELPRTIEESSGNGRNDILKEPDQKEGNINGNDANSKDKKSNENPYDVTKDLGWGKTPGKDGHDDSLAPYEHDKQEVIQEITKELNDREPGKILSDIFNQILKGKVDKLSYVTGKRFTIKGVGAMIHWSGKQHHSDKHMQNIINKVVDMILSDKYTDISINQRLSTSTGLDLGQIFVPDIVGKTAAGLFDIFEAQSPTQPLDYLDEKIDSMRRAIGDIAGDYAVLPFLGQ